MIPAGRSGRVPAHAASVREHALRLSSALVAIALVAACAQTGAPRSESPPAQPPPRATGPRGGASENAEPPPAAVNLSGFPLPYRQGYADGCASAGGTVRKDPARFAADGNYRTGWHDGLALCRRK
jgi:hypothetical protein